MTMTLISSVTVGAGGASSILFSSIPQIYSDIKIVFSGRTTPRAATWDQVLMVINGDTTGGNYAVRDLVSNGSTVASQYWTAFGFLVFDRSLTSDNATSNTFSNGSIYLTGYTSAAAKSISFDAATENNAAESYHIIAAGKYSGTSAVSSITLTPNSNFAQYSTASLYGILKGSGGASVA